MTPFIWKGNPSRQSMTGHQIRGIISLSLFLALIPFISFFLSSNTSISYPILSTAGPAFRAVEFVREKGETGVFFVEPGTSISQFLEITKEDILPAGDREITGGMKIRKVGQGGRAMIRIEKMDAAARLALGLPMDINTAGRDDLVLVPGIGEKTADIIVAARAKKNRFGSLEELKEIRGIKEKKLEKLRPYLCVEP
jgi:competence protein ComEA